MKIELISNNSEFRVSSRQIAEVLDVQPSSLLSLIDDYEDDFKEFGLVGFEIEPRAPGQHGGFMKDSGK
jgi:phage regulator Rha-like protein